MKPISELDLNQKKLFIFDLDGTLIDSALVYRKSDIYAVKKLNGVDVSIEEMIEVSKNLFSSLENDPNLYKNYYLGIDRMYGGNHDIDEIIQAREEALDLARGEVELKEGATELLVKLRVKKNMAQLAIGTGSMASHIDFFSSNRASFHKVINLREVFDHIITFDDIKIPKPSPAIPQKIMENAGVTPDECVIIEDDLRGVRSGKATGAETINVKDRWSAHEQAEIDKTADYQIENLSELTEKL